MAQIPPLNVKVNVDASGVTVGVAKATAGLEQISARSKGLAATFGGLKSTILGVFGGNILTQGVYLLGHELNAMKQETINLQAASFRLNNSLSNLGITAKDTQAAIYQNADALYQWGFQGSEAVNAMSNLVTATRDVGQSQKLLVMSADFVRYRHNAIDIDTASRILARATQGSAKAFRELGITLDTTIPKNQAIAKAFDELNKRIGGQAQAYTKTFSGQMAILKEKFDNVAQVIGARVLPFFTALVKAFSGLATYITNNITALSVFGAIVASVLVTMKAYAVTLAATKSLQQAYAFWTYTQAASTNVFRFALSALWATMKANPVGFIVSAVMLLGTAFVWAWNKFEGFRKGVIKGVQIVINGFGYLIGFVAKLTGLLSKVPGFGFLKGVSEAATQAAKSVREYSDSLDKLANKKISVTPKIPQIKPGKTTGITGGLGAAGDTLKGAGTGSSAQTVQYVTVYASNTNDIARQLSKAAVNGIPVGGR